MLEVRSACPIDARTPLDSDHYVILPGHPTIDGEEIVEDNVTYLVADKNHNYQIRH